MSVPRVFLSAGLALALFCTGAQGIPIGPGFVTWDGFESFEGLSPGSNIVAVSGFPGAYLPGFSTAFTFGSGLVLESPIPNTTAFPGVVVIDYAVSGAPDFGLGGNGTVTGAVVPDGTAFLGLNGFASEIPYIEFALPELERAVGAYVTGVPGSVTLSVYDASRALIESHSVSTVNASLWDTNFIGIYASGIAYARLSGDFEVIDAFSFTTVPEPASLALFALGGAALVACSRRRRQRRA